MQDVVLTRGISHSLDGREIKVGPNDGFRRVLIVNVKIKERPTNDIHPMANCSQHFVSLGVVGVPNNEWLLLHLLAWFPLLLL